MTPSDYQYDTTTQQLHGHLANTGADVLGLAIIAVACILAGVAIAATLRYFERRR